MTYPSTPGYKDQTVSKDNAAALLKGHGPSRAKNLRAMALTLYEEDFVGTADEVAAKLGISPFSMRPRVTELYKDGKLERSHIVHATHYGRTIKSWAMKKAEPKPEPEDDGQPDERQEWFDFDPEC